MEGAGVCCGGGTAAKTAPIPGKVVAPMALCHAALPDYRSNKVGIVAERSRSEVLLPKKRLRSGEWA